MEEKTTLHKVKENICLFLTALSSTAAMAGCCYLYRIPVNEWIGNCVLISLGSFLLFFSLKQDVIFDRYMRREMFHAGYYFIFHMIALAAAVFVPMIPDAVWPYLAIYAILALFGNTVSGILDASLCLAISVIIHGSNQLPVFLMYFLSGCAVAVAFRNLDEDYRFAYPVVIAEIFHLLCLVFYSGYSISFDPSIILFASLNVVLSFVLVLVVLKLYSSIIIHRERDKLMELCNPENSILARIKQKNPADYFKAVHVAHFCDRIGSKLELDVTSLKSAGYYHNVGVLIGKMNWENTLAVCRENQFPDRVTNILQQFLDPDTQLVSTEAVVLYFSESIISSVLFLFQEKKDKKIDYNMMISTVFKSKIDSGVLKQADITYAQLELMKQIFVEEKLYYDFLR